MTAKDELLTQAEEWAQLPLNVEELALALNMTPAAVRLALGDPESQLGLALRRGRVKGRAQLLEKVIQLAQQGSGPAQSLLNELFARNEIT